MLLALALTLGRPAEHFEAGGCTVEDECQKMGKNYLRFFYLTFVSLYLSLIFKLTTQYVAIQLLLFKPLPFIFFFPFTSGPLGQVKYYTFFFPIQPNKCKCSIYHVTLNEFASITFKATDEVRELGNIVLVFVVVHHRLNTSLKLCVRLLHTSKSSF